MNKQSAAGLAIVGFVILLISLIIPIYGLYIGGIALGLVAVGAFFGGLRSSKRVEQGWGKA